jgi:hypothetical protein|tara:strand:- start:280 stop:477 length:198 start_codon:yes stop_codon:yes gene_type:complete
MWLTFSKKDTGLVSAAKWLRKETNNRQFWAGSARMPVTIFIFHYFLSCDSKEVNAGLRNAREIFK